MKFCTYFINVGDNGANWSTSTVWIFPVFNVSVFVWRILFFWWVWDVGICGAPFQCILVWIILLCACGNFNWCQFHIIMFWTNRSKIRYTFSTSPLHVLHVQAPYILLQNHPQSIQMLLVATRSAIIQALISRGSIHLCSSVWWAICWLIYPPMAVHTFPYEFQYIPAPC